MGVLAEGGQGWRVLAASRLQACNSRLGGADPFGHFGLRKASRRPRFQKLVQKGKLFFQLVVFRRLRAMASSLGGVLSVFLTK